MKYFLPTILFLTSGCSPTPNQIPESAQEPANVVSSEAQAAEPTQEEPKPVGTNFVSVGNGIWRMCDGSRMVYFHTSYKHAAIAVVTGQKECQP